MLSCLTTLYKSVTVKSIFNYVTESKNKVAYIEMAHGGHLGFFEGGLLHPNPISWLDRSLVSLIGAIVCQHMEGKHPAVKL